MPRVVGFCDRSGAEARQFRGELRWERFPQFINAAGVFARNLATGNRCVQSPGSGACFHDGRDGKIFRSKVGLVVSSQLRAKGEFDFPGARQSSHLRFLDMVQKKPELKAGFTHSDVNSLPPRFRDYGHETSSASCSKSSRRSSTCPAADLPPSAGTTWIFTRVNRRNRNTARKYHRMQRGIAGRPADHLRLASAVSLSAGPDSHGLPFLNQAIKITQERYRSETSLQVVFTDFEIVSNLEIHQ